MTTASPSEVVTWHHNDVRSLTGKHLHQLSRMAHRGRASSLPGSQAEKGSPCNYKLCKIGKMFPVLQERLQGTEKYSHTECSAWHRSINWDCSRGKDIRRTRLGQAKGDPSSLAFYLHSGPPDAPKGCPTAGHENSSTLPICDSQQPAFRGTLCLITLDTAQNNGKRTH